MSSSAGSFIGNTCVDWPRMLMAGCQLAFCRCSYRHQGMFALHMQNMDERLSPPARVVSGQEAFARGPLSRACRAHPDCVKPLSCGESHEE